MMIKREAVFHSDHRSLHRKNGLQLRFCRPQWFSTFTPNKNDSKVKHRFLQLNGYRLHTFFSLLCFVSILKFALDLFFRFLFFLRIIGWGVKWEGKWGNQLEGCFGDHSYYLIWYLGRKGGLFFGEKKNDISKSTIQIYAFSIQMKIICLPLNAYFQKVIS